MTAPITSSFFARRTRAVFTGVLVAAVILAGALPASAQLSRVGVTKQLYPGALLFGDVAHDPQNDVYLSVMSWGPVFSGFVNSSGDPISTFTIGPAHPAGFTNNPRVAYGPDLNGGAGGFLVTWHEAAGGPNFVHSAVVSYPGGVVSIDTGGVDISAGELSVPNAGGPSIAYSPTAKKFLVTWTGNGWSIKGRLVNGVTGVPEGGVISVVGPIGTRDPSAAWNPQTQEFGVGFAGFGAYMGLVRVNTAGAVVATTGPFGQSTGNYNTALAVNAAGRYVLGWASQGAGAVSLELDSNGNPLAGFPTLISGQLGTPTSFAFALNPVSGTILAVSEGTVSREVLGVETSSTGVPLGIAEWLTDGAGASGAGGSYAPRVGARQTGKQWSVSYSRYNAGYQLANQIIATGSSDSGGGGGPVPLTMMPLTVSPSSATKVAGNPITFKAKANGGIGPHSYQFIVWNGSTWSIQQAYSTSDTFTMTPPAGTYAVQAWARNNGSSSPYDAWTGTNPFVVIPPRATVTGFTVNRTFPSPLNVPITWTATADGAGSAVEYKFLYTQNGGATWAVAQDYGPSNQFTWYPPLGGNNAVQVWVRRVGSTTNPEDWRSTGLFMILSTGAVMESVTPSHAGPTSPSTTLSWTASGIGGSGPLEYKFFLYNQGTGAWSVLQNWSTSRTAYWLPGMTGLIAVQTWVRTIGSGVTYEDWRNTDHFAVTNSTGLTLTADRALTSLRHGDFVTWTAQVAGGGGPWEYQFFTYDGSGWTKQLPAYKLDNTFSWFVSAGVRSLQVWVRPAGSTAAWERWAATGVFVVSP